MRTLIIFLVLIVTSLNCQAQTKVKFDYDPAGNQILRYVCINCHDRVAADTIQSDSGISAENAKENLKTQISYYPNPVKEELNIQWITQDKTSVSSIAVFSMTGQSLGTYSNVESLQSTTVGFGSYPSGFYNVVLYFSDGSKETLKIVKK
jgi:uncharacterized protein YlaI